MKREYLFDLFGKIDADVVEAAEVYVPVKQTAAKGRLRRQITAAAASLVLVAGIGLGAAVLLPRLSGPAGEPFQGTTYPSLETIPLERIGNNYLNGAVPGGPEELWVSGGDFYFSRVTRWVGDDDKHDTVLYKTVFRFNTTDQSCTAVTEEVTDISLVDNRFIYTRAEESLTAENRWEVPWYTNSLAWNDERQISGKDAKRLLNQEKRPTAVIDGMERTYETDFIAEGSIRIRIEGGGTRTISLHDVPSFLNRGVSCVWGLGSVVGIAQDKLYFFVNYTLSVGEEYAHTGYVPLDREQLFVIGLDGKGLRMIAPAESAGSIGAGAYLDESGYLWFHCQGEASSIMRLDTRNDQVETVARVEGYVWEFVKNDGYILCQVAGETAADPSSLVLLAIS